MTPRTVKWDEMFSDEMQRAIDDHPLLYLPYGMCEPHGHHNALRLDGLKAYEICVRAAEEGGGVVAPPPGPLDDPGIEGAREVCDDMMARAEAGEIEWVYLMERERHTQYWSADGEGGRHRARTIETDGAMP